MRHGRTHTFEAATLHPLPVIAVNEGRILGRVKDTIFDPAGHALVGVTVSRRDGKPEDFLAVNRARRLGPFAVTTAASADLRTVESHDRARDVLAAGIRLRGAPVLTDDGEPIGKLAEIWLREDGAVVEYVAAARSFLFSKKRRLTPRDVIVIGDDVMIVHRSAIERRRNDAPAAAATTRQAAPEGSIASDRGDGEAG